MESQSTTLRPRAGAVHSVLFNEEGLRAGWRLAIFAALVGVTGFAALGAVGLLSSGARARPGTAASTSPFWLALAEIAQFSAVALSAWIMSLIEKRPAASYGLPLIRTAFPRFAAGCLIWGFLPLTAILLIMRALGAFYFGGLAIHGWPILYWAAAWGLMFLSVGLLEEYLFRGYALHTLAGGIGFWPAAIVLGVAFAGVHLGNGGENRIGIVDVLIFALFAAAALRRTGSLWLAVGAHAGWDWGESFFYGVSDSGYQATGHLLNPHVQGPDWLSGGSVGPEGSIVTLIFWVLMTLSMLFLYRPRLAWIGTAPGRPTHAAGVPSP